jgi:hypothetical protein
VRDQSGVQKSHLASDSGYTDQTLVSVRGRYSCRFEAWMEDLNRRFEDTTGGATTSALHYGFVQIGTDCGPSAHTFRTRIGQCNNNKLWPNTFMAPAMDLPNNLESGAPAGGVHLMDKITIAERLLVGAMSSVYSKLSPLVGHYAGPSFLRAEETTLYPPKGSASAPNGSQVVVHFSVPGGAGIEVRSDDAFELNSACGWGGSWVPARIVDHNATSITLVQTLWPAVF